MRAPVYGVQLVRERSVAYETRRLLETAPDAAAFLSELLGAGACEQMAVVGIDGTCRVVGAVVVAKGGISTMMVSPSEVLRAALLLGTACFVIGHNHPSGDTTPSREDVVVTRKIAAGAASIGLQLVDHIIVAADGRFYSMAEKGPRFDGVADEARS